MVSTLEMEYDEQITAAVNKGVQRLDIASPNWAKGFDYDLMFMDEVHCCLLAQMYGSYMGGLQYLGIDRGEEYGFDIPDTIFDIDSQYEAYEILAQKWCEVIDSRA